MSDRLSPEVLTEPAAPAKDVRARRGLRRLFSNAAAMAIGNVAARGLGYLYIVLIAKRVSASDIGIYAILLTASMILELVSNLGLDKIIIREIVSGGEARGRAIFWGALRVRLQIAAGMSVVCWLILRASYPDLFSVHGLSAAAFLFGVIPAAAARNCESFVTAQEMMFPIALSQIAERVSVCLAAVGVYFGIVTFDQFLALFLLSAFVRLGAISLGCRHLFRTQLRLVRVPLAPLLKDATQLFSVELMALVYFRADTFMLSKMASLHDTGIYQIAYKIFDFTISLFTGFLLAAFPRLVTETGRSDLRWMLPGGSLLLLVPAGLIILLRRPVLRSFRAEYLEGSTALVWLMLTVPLVYVTSLISNSLIASNGINFLARFAILLVAFNVGCNYFLIPHWSLNGAAFATFASELVSACALLIVISRKRIAIAGHQPVKAR